jgi:hypothetical protein
MSDFGAGSFEEIMAELKKQGFTPEVQEDSSFEPFAGKYVARITECGRKKGIGKNTNEPYDFISMKLEIVEHKEGAKAIGRRLDKVYSMDDKGMKALMNDLFTAGINNCNSASEEEFEMFLSTLTDKLVNVSCWARPKSIKNAEGKWEEKVPKEMKQWYKIVATLKLKGAEGAKVDNSSVPF